MDIVLLNKLKTIMSQNNDIVFAYIFGSYACGKQTQNSDVDFAVYFSGGNIDTVKYLNLKRELMDISSKEVDVVILNNANPLVKHEVFKDGICLFSRNKEIENNFIVKSLFEYEDMKKYYNLSYKSMIEHVRKEVENNG